MKALRIAIVGERGSGKDCAGDFFTNRFGCEKIALATPMKASLYAGLAALVAVCRSSWKYRWIAPLLARAIQDKGVMRKPMQEAGLALRTCDEDILVRSLIGRHHLNCDETNRGFVVTDVRYINEAALREQGFVIIRITAPAEVRKARALSRGDKSWREEDALHPSEVEQRAIVADETVDNSTDDLQNLHDQLLTIANRYV